MWSMKCYVKRNISCDVHLLNELLETDVPWDDGIVVSAGTLRNLWDSLRELRSFLCERRLERTVLRPALLPVKTAQFSVWKTTRKANSEACAITCQNCAVYSVFPSGVTSHVKITQFDWRCTAPWRLSIVCCVVLCARVYIISYHEFCHKMAGSKLACFVGMCVDYDSWQLRIAAEHDSDKLQWEVCLTCPPSSEDFVAYRVLPCLV